MFGTILIVVLVLALIGALPRWSHSRQWGYAPTGGLGFGSFHRRHSLSARAHLILVPGPGSVQVAEFAKPTGEVVY